jgi:hypothetical protein
LKYRWFHRIYRDTICVLMFNLTFS